MLTIMDLLREKVNCFGSFDVRLFRSAIHDVS